MNEYIFYTAEGYTMAPDNGVEVDNCQVLGRTEGRNKNDALNNLLKDNPWIKETKYNQAEFIVAQVLTEKQLFDIKKIVEYLWKDEKRHYEEWYEVGLGESGLENGVNLDDAHIFSTVKRLKEMYEDA